MNDEKTETEPVSTEQAPKAPQTENVVNLIRDLTKAAKSIAEESVQLEECCKAAYSGWRPDGRGVPQRELDEAHCERRRIRASIKANEDLVDRLYTRLSHAEAEISAAFSIVNAVKTLRK